MADEERSRSTLREARAGEPPGMTRYVLGISLALVIIIFAVLVFR